MDDECEDSSASPPSVVPLLLHVPSPGRGLRHWRVNGWSSTSIPSMWLVFFFPIAVLFLVLVVDLGSAVRYVAVGVGWWNANGGRP